MRKGWIVPLLAAVGTALIWLAILALMFGGCATARPCGLSTDELLARVRCVHAAAASSPALADEVRAAIVASVAVAYGAARDAEPDGAAPEAAQRAAAAAILLAVEAGLDLRACP